jgi:trans-aconitate methyltransferase
VGGGDSKLVDYLLAEGYENLTVLDLSANAIERAKQRLGPEQAAKVTWLVTDVLDFQPEQAYDLWHDRATFHFLTAPEAIQQYQQLVQKAVKKYMVMGTFSDQGPDKCSGLPVRQYSAGQLTALFAPEFRKIRCEHAEHRTPSGQPQAFLFCSFKTDR